MKRLKKMNDLINMLLIILLVAYLSVGTTIKIIFDFSYYYFSLGLFCFGFCALFFYTTYKIINRDKIHFKDLFILLLIIFAYISYKFALDGKMALYGAEGRFEGLLVILSYYFIFLLASTLNKDQKKVIFYTIIISGIYQILLGTIQTLRIENILGYDRSDNWSAHFKFASGTLSNPNFYSSYILMCLMLVYGKLLQAKDKKHGIIYGLLTLLFGYGLIIGNTTSCYLAAGLIILITLLTKINKNNIKKVVLYGSSTLGLLIALILIFDQFANHRITYTMNKNFIEIKNIFKKGITDETGNYRVYVWKKTLSYAPKYYLTGMGIDNFSLINEGNYICVGIGSKGQCFDKAHNEYLQKFITEGIFSIITYLGLLVFTIIKYIKNKEDRKENYIYFLAFLAYLIQAFFNISVIMVAPLFYIVMGLLNENKKYSK